MSATYKFLLPGISCVNCVKPIEYRLSLCKRYNIESYHVDIVNKTIVITVGGHDSQREDVREYLKAEITDVGVECEDILEEDQSRTVWQNIADFFLSHWFQGALGTVAGIALLTLMLVTGGLPLAAMIAIGGLSTLITLLIGARSFYHAAVKLVKGGVLTMDTLFTISSLTVIVVSVTAFFIPWLPMMFEVGLLIFGFRHIGLAIEESIKQKMELDKTFQHLLPFEVRIKRADNTYEERALGVIAVHDILLINPGEIIPVDGVALDEDCLVYDTIKTGDPMPRRLIKGEQLISGMRLAQNSAPLHLHATANVENSYLARLDKSIEKAHMEKKAPIEEVAARILQYFIPTVLGIALLSGILIGIFFTPTLALLCAISVLVSACPCTLGLVVALAVIIGMQKAAEHGVQFKNAKALQDADSIDAVVFDLNGTLTTGVPVVCRTRITQPDMDEASLLAVAAAIEKNSTHTMAKTICDEAVTKKIPPMLLPDDASFDMSSHSGIRAKFNDESWVIGNEDIMREDGISLEGLDDLLQLQAGESVVYVARNNKLCGYFVVSDCLRKEAFHTIDALRKLGKEIYICTGASPETARRYARVLGIPDSHIAAKCVGMDEQPGDRSKTSYVNELKEQGLRVAFIGDGDNDSLVIANSDFGIAVKSISGSEITQLQAGAVIQSGSLLPVANAFAVARQTVNNIKQNLVFSLTYNTATLLVAGGLLVGIGFVLNPGVGVALMIVQTVLVLLNAWRFKAQPLAHLKEPYTEEYANTHDSYSYLGKVMKTSSIAPGIEHDLEDTSFGSVLSSGVQPAKSVVELDTPKAPAPSF